MMLRPAIGDLLEKIGTKEKPGTRYALVIAASKRARKLNDEYVPVPKAKAVNFVSKAIEQIDDGSVRVIANSDNN